ncbi:MAG: 23S rRNA (uracil(1939)-C(5))-methyltransferase RlmD [Erysipelotrichaceae bacterium]
MVKNDILIGTAVDYTSEGFGVVKIDGFPVFVKGLLVNEEAKIGITLVKKSYAFARIIEIIKVSDKRNEDIVCSYSKRCGGCQLLHMKYSHQLEFKKSLVENIFQRIGKVDVKVFDVVPMENPYEYRNKVQIPVGNDNFGKMISGFYRINSNDIIDMDSCIMQSSLSNEIYQFTKKMLLTDNNYQKTRHIVIKHAFSTNEVMVCFVVGQRLKNPTKMVKMLTKEFPLIKSIIVNYNSKDTNVILGEQEEIIYNQGFIYDYLNDLKFKISLKSFYQINSVQTINLYNKAIELAQLKPTDIVLDLYCGIGTITLFASKFVKKVVGVEIVKQAINNAIENMTINNITNCEFVVGDAGEVANKLDYKFNVIFVDPPRKGLDDIAKDSIIKMDPEKIVYVSCDPATLARDVAYFKEYGYVAKDVYLYDMFPNTKHVECVCLLTRIK